MKAYKYLKEKNIHLNRVDENKIVVWTNGYKSAEYFEIESDLMKLDLFCLSMEFDQTCGKTMSTYVETKRHKK